MADDFRIENYKRAIEALVEGWATDEIEYGAQLTPIEAPFDPEQGAYAHPHDDDDGHV